MKIAIMQPYFLPYIGYFQLVDAVDIFVALDNVNFIKKGWINRNNLVFNGAPKLFSIPLANISQFNLINEITISKTEFEKWKKSFLKSVMCHYKKQIYYEEGMSLLEEIFSGDICKISDLAFKSIRSISDRLNLATRIVLASELDCDQNFSGSEKLVQICRYLGGDTYINPPGGKALYAGEMFSPYGIELKFLRPSLISYPAIGEGHVPGLSILDAILCRGAHYVSQNLLPGYALEMPL